MVEHTFAASDHLIQKDKVTELPDYPEKWLNSIFSCNPTLFLSFISVFKIKHQKLLSWAS
jgi:hypothetical protein